MLLLLAQSIRSYPRTEKDKIFLRLSGSVTAVHSSALKMAHEAIDILIPFLLSFFHPLMKISLV